VSISTDITWDNPGTAIWSCVELNVGIICASLPALRALASRFFPTMFPSRTGGSNREEQSGGSRYRNRNSRYSVHGPLSSNGFGSLTDDDAKYTESGARSPSAVNMGPLSGRFAPNHLGSHIEKRTVPFLTQDEERAARSNHFSDGTHYSESSDDDERPADRQIRVITDMSQTVERNASIPPQRQASSVRDPISGRMWLHRV
jgi:hypothetical protein